MDQAKTATTDRLDYIDALRGFALFGVFGANLFLFAGLDYYMSEAQLAALPTAAADSVVNFVEKVLIDTKFMGLFAFLFGVSFWLFLTRAEARGAHGTQLFLRRLSWLFAFGALHGWLLWAFDILRFYALWGLLLPLFLRVPNRALLSSAFAFAIVLPALVSGIRAVIGHGAGGENIPAEALQAFASGSYAEMLAANWRLDWHLTLSVSQIGYQVAILGRLLFGLYAARNGLLMDLPAHRTLYTRVLIWGGLFGLAANTLDVSGMLETKNAFFPAFAARFIVELGYLSLSLAYASGLALLFQTPLGGAVRALKSLGRMALTFYLSQTLFGLWLFYGFMPGLHLMGKLGAVWLLPIWFIGYAIQVWLAALWLKHFRFGPAEWLWRCLTYQRLQPFRLAPRPV